ncbi:MAG: collagenase-like protease [Proteobacteria bacterium]|nr:collagenase-like protease [Pseudomonadota bacterium]
MLFEELTNMQSERHRLELLAPAKNLESGREAIIHGADAVYIGGPAFGARAAAGNSIADIGELATFAHRYRARVLVALNTILHDHELEDARKLVWQLYEAGADALIVQDMGLLQLDLPPIELHASTQTDNRSVQKVRFLQDAGFSQIVLARELSLAQISEIAAETHAALEFFIHGALCVSYSGQCYISHAQTGRSANRGECAQLCRLPYSLTDAAGKLIAQDQHLLSLKDMNQSANLRALIDAGISSFKIEGRLKDLSYVKNVTAHYRRLLDEQLTALPGYRRASSGASEFFFTPQPEKSFNRGATDYFLQGRKIDIGAFLTPKFAGEPVGKITRLNPQWFEIASEAEIHNGDGFSYFNAKNELVGLRINRAQSLRLFPNEMPSDLAVGMTLYRNLDHEFEKQLEKQSAERRIRIDLLLADTSDGLALTLTDEDGVSATATLLQAKEPARDAERAMQGMRDALAKLGNTLFIANTITLDLAHAWFVPASALNALRREAVENLEIARTAAYQRPERWAPASPPTAYPSETLSYLGNVNNKAAREFYAAHGVQQIAPAFEQNREAGEVSLMITKHCLRYSFNLCPKQVKGTRPDPLQLVRGQDSYTLKFDCKRCEMHVVGKLKGNKPLRKP